MVDILVELDALADELRIVNCVLAILGFLFLAFCYAKDKWDFWDVQERLVWMSHVFMCGVLSYGSVEAVFLETNVRAPMATVSVIFLFIAYFWPGEKEA